MKRGTLRVYASCLVEMASEGRLMAVAHLQTRARLRKGGDSSLSCHMRKTRFIIPAMFSNSLQLELTLLNPLLA